MGYRGGRYLCHNAGVDIKKAFEVDLKLPIEIIDEVGDELVRSSGLLDLASGEIRRVEYRNYDVGIRGLPCEQADYDFTVGILSNHGKDVEFTVQVNKTTGVYSVTPSELLEIKEKAAALFAGHTALR